MAKNRKTFPEKATMFYCIGAQKAGTTWLYDALRQSSNVHFCRNKELHYFDVIAGRGKLSLQNRIDITKILAGKLVAKTGPGNTHALKQLRELAHLLTIYTGEPGDHTPYLDYLLRGYRDQPVVCDITPAYAILDREHFADMASIGQAKFLFIMRDPIERMWSQIRMAVSVQFKGQDIDFDAACAERAKTLIETQRLPRVERANYLATITELEAAVSAQHIKYVFYEDLFLPKAMIDICSFLGIPPIPSDEKSHSNLGRKANIPRHLHREFRKTFAPQYTFVHERFGSAVPDSWNHAPSNKLLFWKKT